MAFPAIVDHNTIAPMIPPNDYTMVCFKNGTVFIDQMSGGASTLSGTECAVGDVGWIIEKDERPTSALWAEARFECLKDGMRLPELFEWRVSCDNQVAFGLVNMVGNFELASNTAEIQDAKSRTLAAGLQSCANLGTIDIGGNQGESPPQVFRCAR